MARFICSTMVLATLWGPTALAQGVPARYLLAGSLRGEAVQLELTLPASPTDESSEHISGRRLSTPPEPLTGTVAENGDVRVQSAGLGTLTLREHLSDPAAQPAFTGTTGSGDAFSLELIASYTTQRLTQGPFLEASWSVPYFLAPPWRRVNRPLQNAVRVPAATFIGEAQGLLEEGALGFPYAFESELEIVRLTPNVLSLLERRYTYTGGAHPNTGYRSLTYQSQNIEGEVRRIGLNDLFRDGAAYRRILLDEVTLKLRARRAAWIEDSSVTLTARDLGVFTLTGRGLEFVFAPYAVGPYAQGAFFVTVPYEQLQGLLKPAFTPTR